MSDDRAGMDMGRQLDPEAVRQVAYEDLWPGAGMTLEQALLLPGKIEAGSR